MAKKKVNKYTVHEIIDFLMECKLINDDDTKEALEAYQCDEISSCSFKCVFEKNEIRNNEIDFIIDRFEDLYE